MHDDLLIHCWIGADRKGVDRCPTARQSSRRDHRRKPVGFAVSAEQRLEAYQIYCDEGYHALYGFDVIKQVESATGVPFHNFNIQPFIDHLDEIGDRALADLPVLARTLQVVVFETLITAILSEVPGDRSVRAPGPRHHPRPCA
ncbi:hypothetical protein [Actinoallomurus oryzae]|uniref:hypothetical protein n=1 Tax=Actinoallomurus oryzae TaxID=502180 RepID=UPI0031E8129D